MQKYQLHLNGKNRAVHTFNTKEEAESHKVQLIKLCQDKMSGEYFKYKAYYDEAKKLEIVEIELNKPEKWFSIVESTSIGSSIIGTYPREELALKILSKYTNSDKREFGILTLRFNRG